MEESQLDKLRNKKLTIHIIRLLLTSEKGHVLGDCDVLIELLRKCTKYICIFITEGMTTPKHESRQKCFEQHLLVCVCLWYFYSLNSFMASSCAEFNFSFLVSIFRTERKARVLIVLDNTPLYSIITEMSPSQGALFNFQKPHRGHGIHSGNSAMNGQPDMRRTLVFWSDFNTRIKVPDKHSLTSVWWTSCSIMWVNKDNNTCSRMVKPLIRHPYVEMSSSCTHLQLPFSVYIEWHWSLRAVTQLH